MMTTTPDEERSGDNLNKRRLTLMTMRWKVRPE